VDLPIRQSPKLVYVVAYTTLNLSLRLSAEIADSFRMMTVEKSGKNEILITY